MYLKQKLTELQRERDKSIVIMGYSEIFKTTFIDLNTLYAYALLNIYRTLIQHFVFQAHMKNQKQQQEAHI